MVLSQSPCPPTISVRGIDLNRMRRNHYKFRLEHISEITWESEIYTTTHRMQLIRAIK